MSSTLSVTYRPSQSLQPTEQTCPLLRTFPDELVLSILRKLSVQDLRACSLSCKQLNGLIQDDSLWRSLFHQAFPHEKLPPAAIPHEAYKAMSNLHSNIKKGVYSSMVLRDEDPYDQVLCLTQANGKLVSGSAHGKIEIWDCQTGMHLREFEAGHEQQIHALAFADGKLFAAVGEEIQIWDYQTETCLEVLEGHEGEVFDLVVHNGMLFSASGDNTVKIWDLKTSDCIYTVENEEEDDEVLLMIVTNGHLLSATSKGKIHIFDLDYFRITGWGVTQHIAAHESRINAMTLDEEGRLITCSDDKTIKVWNNYRLSQCLRTIMGHTGTVDSLVRAGEMIITSSEDRTVRMWNYLTGRCLSVLEIDSLPPYVICPLFFSNGMLFSVLEDTQTKEERKIEIWNFKATEEAVLHEIATLFKSQDPQDYTRAMTRFSRLSKRTKDKIFCELEGILKESMSKKPKTDVNPRENGEKAFYDKDGFLSSLNQAEAIELYLAKQKRQNALSNA